MRFSIIILCCLLLNEACQKANIIPETKKPEFQDSLINRTIYLNNAESFVQAFGNLMALISMHRNKPAIYLADADNSTYLRLVYYPGSPSNSFSYFEVRKVRSTDTTIHYKFGYYGFISESGIATGMKKEDVLKLKGFHYHRTRTGDVENLKYLAKRSYSEQYTFEDDVLIK